MERSLLSLLFSVCFLFTASSASFLPIGIHPLDEKYYASEVINCKDGSKSFSRDRINDNFCDCPDGTDEPGTPACPTGKFYCKNIGSTPRFLFSSHVNDHFCDCCDGSDENDGSAICPNICMMGGNVAYKDPSYGSTTDMGFSNVKVTQKGVLEDSSQRVAGLKIVIIVQAILVSASLISFVVVFRSCRRRVRLRRRHSR